MDYYTEFNAGKGRDVVHTGVRWIIIQSLMQVHVDPGGVVHTGDGLLQKTLMVEYKMLFSDYSSWYLNGSNTL